MSTATALLQELEWLRQHGQSQSNVVGISGLVKFLYTIPVVTTVKIVTIFISYFLKPFLNYSRLVNTPMHSFPTRAVCYGQRI